MAHMALRPGALDRLGTPVVRSALPAKIGPRFSWPTRRVHLVPQAANGSSPFTKLPPTSPKLPDSKLPENTDSQQTPEREPDTGLGKLLKLLSKYPVTSWLASLAERLLKGTAQGSDMRALKIVRMILILSIFCIAALFREASVQNTRVKPREVGLGAWERITLVCVEVLYSTFVSMLDEGKVKAARLEAGTSKLYFDVIPLEQQAALDAAAAAVANPVDQEAAMDAAVAVATATAATPSTSAAVAGQAATATTAATVPAQAGAAPAVTFSPAYRMQKQYFIKLADKNDLLLVHRVVTAGVEFAVVKASLQGVLYNILLSALALWLPLMPIIFLVRRIMEDRTSSARKKRPSSAENVTVTFDDVAGVDSAKEELSEVVSVMKAAKASYKRLKVKMPSGVILCGPPGTGKTLLAKAVAGEAGIPFMAVSASEFVEMYVGRGAARIRELFAEARKVAPCVVFIDELDAVGARRGMGYNDERDQTLNQLLTELDGFEGRPGVLFLAATNRIDVLDPALLRPGRLSRKVVVPLPDEPGRQDILTVHLRGVPISEEEDKEDLVLRLSKVTSGFSGAELANVVNEASLLAARKTQDFVTFRELLEGVQRTRYGVNGQTGAKTSMQQSLNNWLMNLATDSVRQNGKDRRVKNATA